jgi:hypothetical protein
MTDEERQEMKDDLLEILHSCVTAGGFLALLGVLALMLWGAWSGISWVIQ